MKKVLILSLVALFSCEKPFCNEKPNDEIAGIVIRVVGHGGYLAYDRAQGSDLARNGIHITTNEQYRLVFADCCANQLDSIDFRKYDILGATTIDRGVHSTYLRDVQMDSTNKKVTYTITDRYCRKSSPVQGTGNFVLVPKLPADYRIEYVRKK